MWPRDYSCAILVTDVTAFCPCPKSLPGAKWKKYMLIASAEDFQEQPCIAYGICIMFTLMQLNIMIRSKLSKKTHNIYRKGAQGSGMYLNLVFQNINKLKKIWILNGIEGQLHKKIPRSNL